MSIPFGQAIIRDGTGRIASVSPNIIRFKGNTHGATVAGTRAGKFTMQQAMEIIEIARSGHSQIILDTKGQIASTLWSAILSFLGRLAILNPYDHFENLLPPCCGFNFLNSLDPKKKNFLAKCESLASLLIDVETGESKQWMTRAINLVTGLIAHSVLYEPAENKNLVWVYRVLCSGLNYFNSIISTSLAIGDFRVTQFLANYEDTRDEHKGRTSSIDTAVTSLKFLGDPAISDCISRDDFRALDLRREPTTLIIVMPGELDAVNGRFMRLVLGSLLNDLMEHTEGVPVTLLIDEAYSLGRVEILSTLLSKGAGYGVRTHTFWQSTSQIEELYKGGWRSFTSSGFLQVFGIRPGDAHTAQYIAEMAGDRTQLVPGMSVSQVSVESMMLGFSGVSASYSLQKVPEILPQDVYRAGPREQFLFLDGVSRLIEATRYAYWEVPKYRALVRPDPYHDLPGALRMAALNPPPRRLPRESRLSTGRTIHPEVTRYWPAPVLPVNR